MREVLILETEGLEMERLEMEGTERERVGVERKGVEIEGVERDGVNCRCDLDLIISLYFFYVLMYRKRALVCRDKLCKSCTAPPCGTCSNCRHPEFKNKCVQR